MRLADLRGRHAGEIVYVIATGDTMDDFDFDAMGDAPRILIHRAAMVPDVIQHVEGRTYWYLLDDPWVGQTPGEWDATLDRVTRGEMVGVFASEIRKTLGDQPNVAYYTKSRDIAAITDDDPQGDTLFRFRGGCGPTTSHLAAVLGAGRIELVGFNGERWSKHLRHLYTGVNAPAHRNTHYQDGYQATRQTLDLIGIPYAIDGKESA